MGKIFLNPGDHRGSFPVFTLQRCALEKQLCPYSLTGDAFLQRIWQLANALVGSHNASSFSSVKVLNIY